MKKSKMIVTALTIFFMFSSAKAQEEIKIDFDGRSFRTMNIVEMLKTDISANAFEMPDRESEPEILDKIDKKEFNKNLDYSIKSAIEYCRKNNIDEFITDNFKKLLVYGTEDEKIEFIKSTKYLFPKKFRSGREVDFNEHLNLESKGVTPVCIKWEKQEVCVDKEVCETVCVAGAVTCYAITLPSGLPSTVCGAGAAVCTLVCKLKPKCTNVPVCVEWYSDIYY
ncbi:MAG: hypothetical protein HY746_10015 [Elusimicrobia bacterium]|nr:hypothetical protein [Elusimicrobiota bacterium]